MSQSSRAQKPLYLEFAGSKKKLLDHVSDSTFSPQFRQQLFTFLHLVSSGDLAILDTDGGQMTDTCSYQLQNVFRWWACPENLSGSPRFLSQNQSYHTPAAEAESAAMFENHFPNGVDGPAVFKLAGNEEFQMYYTSFLRARRDAFLARQDFLDAFLPAKIDPELLQYNTPYDYILHVWRFSVNFGSLQDMTRPLTELLIDSTGSFKQVALQLQKNLCTGTERLSFRNGDDVLNYSLVFFTNFTTLGFDQEMQDKPNKKAPSYSARQICPFTTQQNNTMTNLLLGSIENKPNTKGGAEYTPNTALTRAFVSTEGNASHSTRVQLEECFNEQFFRTCQSHAVNIPNTMEFYKDGTIYAGVYPYDCWITIPTLLFNQLQNNNLATNFDLPKELELNSIENVGFCIFCKFEKIVFKNNMYIDFSHFRIPGREFVAQRCKETSAQHQTIAEKSSVRPKKHSCVRRTMRADQVHCAGFSTRFRTNKQADQRGRHVSPVKTGRVC